MGFIFFWLNAGGQTSQPIFMQNGLIDVDSRKDVPFAVKIEKNFKTLTSRTLKPGNFGKFLDIKFQPKISQTPIIKLPSRNDPS